MTDSLQFRFRSLLSGLFLAAVLTRHRQVQRASLGNLPDAPPTRAELDWVTPLLALGQHLSCQGSSPAPLPDELAAGLSAAAESQVLSLLPAVLCWLDPHPPTAHLASAAFRDWLKSGSWSTPVEAAAIELFELLTDTAIGFLGSAGRLTDHPIWQNPTFFQTPLMQSVQRQMQQSAGQYPLIVKQGWATTAPLHQWALAGALTAWYGGLASLPLQWRLIWQQSTRWDQGSADAALPEAFPTEAELWALADNLYARWAGVRLGDQMPYSPRLPLTVRSVTPALIN